MKKKKILWIILLIIGLVPLIIPLIYSIGNAIFGFSGICFIGCKNDYGLSAFFDSMVLYSFVFWPTYIIGLILIIVSIIFLKRGSKKCPKKSKKTKQ